MRKVLICIVPLLLLGCSPGIEENKVSQEVGNVVATAEIISLYESPEDTIRTYYERDNLEDVSNCFYPSGFSGTLEKFWSDYEIVKKEKSKLSGEKNYNDLTISNDAVEMTVEVKMKETQKKTRFWYLLQPIEGQWKIIEHSHVPDNNYPAYD